MFDNKLGVIENPVCTMCHYSLLNTQNVSFVCHECKGIFLCLNCVIN